ncbi:MAG: hypothetical protein AB7S26_38075 [Sandaracinaceae bacterium]
MVVPCDAGLRCERRFPPDLDSEWICKPEIDGMEGDPCVDFCAHGFSCNPDTSRCEAWVRVDPPRPGDSCDETQFNLCDWQIGTACVAGTCVVAGGGAGSTCDARPTADFRIGAYCAPPAACNIDTLTCGEALELGADCYDDAVCASGCCDFLGSSPRCADVSVCAGRPPCP